MSEKRRDSKNRILRSGESQRKDGRYAYKYTDTFGKPQFVYAWKLVPTNKTPKGKREDKSLPEKVKGIQKDFDDEIDLVGKKMTVYQLYEKHIRNHANVRHGTKQWRKQLMRIIKEDTIGACSIENVKMSDAKEWALRMKEKGYSFITISNHKRSLKAAFYTTIQDDCIKNPFDFHINTVIEDDTEPKIPLSPMQEESLISFAKSDKVYYKYYDELIILLGTGLRISEFCGLTDSDIDFENRTINVNHQLQYSGKKSYRIETPKTENGIRKIPMSDRVLEALQRVVQNQRKSDFTVDGYTGFLFLTRNGTPQNYINYDIMLRKLVEEYNKKHEEVLPVVTTPHTLRHTFCTNMANTGMNPKALQYLIGHANITMTLNYYAHATFDSAQADFFRLAA